MKSRKKYESCIDDGNLIETGVADKALAAELVAMAAHRERFWKEANLSGKYPSLYVEGHYEIIKEMCTAILALDGWKALDHESLFAYMQKKRKNVEIDFEYLLDLKDARNGIDYRGVMVSKEIWNENAMKIRLTINALKEYLNCRLMDGTERPD